MAESSQNSIEKFKELITNKLTLFGDRVQEIREFRGEITVLIKREALLDICRFLKDDPDLWFDMLGDVTAIDRLLLPENKPRFVGVYQFFSTKFYYRIRLKALIPEEDCSIDSLVSIWKGADWLERETYDFFGINYKGHPNLTRILMPEDWEGWPLRKDFPLGGVKSFYFKRDTNPHAGEPPDLIPRIREQKDDI